MIQVNILSCSKLDWMQSAKMELQASAAMQTLASAKNKKQGKTAKAAAASEEAAEEEEQMEEAAAEEEASAALGGTSADTSADTADAPKAATEAGTGGLAATARLVILKHSFPMSFGHCLSTCQCT